MGGACHLSIGVGGGYKEGEGDPRDPKPSPSDCFSIYPYFGGCVRFGRRRRGESERGNLKKQRHTSEDPKAEMVP